MVCLCKLGTQYGTKRHATTEFTLACMRKISCHILPRTGCIASQSTPHHYFEGDDERALYDAIWAAITTLSHNLTVCFSFQNLLPFDHLLPSVASYSPFLHFQIFLTVLKHSRVGHTPPSTWAKSFSLHVLAPGHRLDSSVSVTTAKIVNSNLRAKVEIGIICLISY